MNKNIIFVGTFDPMHGGHIGQLLRAYKFMPFTKAYILVDKYPSRKPHATKWQHRAKMANLLLHSANLPFNYEVIASNFPLDPVNISYTIDYGIAGIDSLIDSISDDKELQWVKHWPTIALSIPNIPRSKLDDKINSLPNEVRESISYEYVDDKLIPMMNYKFEDNSLSHEIVHSSNIRTGSSSYFLPKEVNKYIECHKLYKN